MAAGAVAKRLLAEFGIMVYSWVTEIGNVSGQWSVAGEGTVPDLRTPLLNPPLIKGETKREVESGLSPECGTASSIYYSSFASPHFALSELFDKAEKSDVRCPDAKATEAIKKKIDEARDNGDSIGGIFEIVVSGVPAGLGSHVQWDRKLNARLSMALMSIQAIKGVELGLGFEAARRPGSEVHDEIDYSGQGSVVSGQQEEGDCPGGTGFQPVRNRQDACSTIYEKGFYRNTNNAGGIEGGMSNGEDIVLRAAMKPIPTLYKPLRSVDIETREAFEASIERSDICAVPAASVVGEAVVAIEIANAMLEKFGGDSMEEMKRNYESYMEYVRGF